MHIALHTASTTPSFRGEPALQGVWIQGHTPIWFSLQLTTIYPFVFSFVTRLAFSPERKKRASIEFLITHTHTNIRTFTVTSHNTVFFLPKRHLCTNVMNRAWTFGSPRSTLMCRHSFLHRTFLAVDGPPNILGRALMLVISIGPGYEQRRRCRAADASSTFLSLPRVELVRRHSTVTLSLDRRRCKRRPADENAVTATSRNPIAHPDLDHTRARPTARHRKYTLASSPFSTHPFSSSTPDSLLQFGQEDDEGEKNTHFLAY